jgi:hypothetical protein
MAINNALFTNTATISTTEYSLTNNSTVIATQTTDAVISIWIDATAMAAGDQYEIALRERVIGGGTQRRAVLATLTGTQAEPFVSSPYQVGDGWDVTVTKIGGTDRSFSWSIRGVT